MTLQEACDKRDYWWRISHESMNDNTDSRFWTAVQEHKKWCYYISETKFPTNPTQELCAVANIINREALNDNR